ncbi:MAG TPA: hypothetical protein VJV79_25110 [Polyangiaceae bacterium]|nr:hypothetical protein [Polyangiaceae bacterium]
MTEPRRLKELSTALPFELSQALDDAPADPSELEQQMLLQSLGSTLGIALSLPSVAASPLSAASAANVSAGFGAQVSTAVSLATKPGVAFLIWFGGGLTLGTVLSAAALLSSQLPSPRPEASNRTATSGLATRSRPAMVIAPTAKASAALPESDLDAGVRASPPSTETAMRSSTRDKSREQPAAEADSEFSLLRNAQQSLNMDPQRALELCAAHARRFPSGVMVQEREMIGIEALLRLGRIQQADARASTFLRLFPGSAHAARLKNLLQRSKF